MIQRDAKGEEGGGGGVGGGHGAGQVTRAGGEGPKSR